jgi:hypothetical protein
MSLSRNLTVTLALSVACLLATKTDATEGLKECLHKNQKGAQITTPTHAAIKRQCDNIKKGIASLPGVKQLCPNARTWGTQMK